MIQEAKRDGLTNINSELGEMKGSCFHSRYGILSVVMWAVTK
jgi:hypothetical protein